MASWKRSNGIFSAMSGTIPQDNIQVTPRMVEAGTIEFRRYSIATTSRTGKRNGWDGEQRLTAASAASSVD